MGEMNTKKWLKQNVEWLLNESILGGYRGSIAHGMYVPQSDPDSIDDKDLMFIVIPGLAYYYGISQWGSRGTKEIFQNEYDIVAYELRKMVSLLEKGNPNVLSLLWLESPHYIVKTPAGEHLINNRDLFATRSVYHSFVGYAYGQLKRMTHFKFEGYMGVKRKALVEKYGYDCKNAAHLIRLLKMGIEFLREGYLHVMREDAAQLLEIKTGEWTLDKVKNYADRLFARIENAYDESKLPDKPNREAVNMLCIEICTEVFGS